MGGVGIIVGFSFVLGVYDCRAFGERGARTDGCIVKRRIPYVLRKMYNSKTRDD